MLFCEREEVSSASTPSRINPFLSLAQTRNLRLQFFSNLSLKGLPYYPKRDLSTSRFSDPLSLELLHVSTGDGTDLIDGSGESPLLEYLHISLFPILNPIRLEYNCLLDDYPSRSQIRLGGVPLLHEWTRFEVADFIGGLPYLIAGDGTDCHIAAIPLWDDRVFRLHVKTLFESWTASVGQLVDFWCHRQALEGLFGISSSEGTSVVFVVESEEEAEEARLAIQQTDEYYRSSYAVEVQL